MSGRIAIGFIDFAVLLFDFVRVRYASIRLILVRNWCGPRLAIEIPSSHIRPMELGNRRLEDLGLHEVRNVVAP
jgi:hypothetical protein